MASQSQLTGSNSAAALSREGNWQQQSGRQTSKEGVETKAREEVGRIICVYYSNLK
jgi:hypothetical protein